MQHVTLIAVGRANAYYAQGVAEYEKRLRAYCKFSAVEVAEEALREKNASAAVVRTALQKEGARILAAVPRGARLAALCIEGTQMTSEEFACFLQDAAQSGAPGVAFAIGSSHGLDGAVKEAADRKLSLSRMTLPHQLARLVLAEQLYRGMAIRAGAKYHK